MQYDAKTSSTSSRKKIEPERLNPGGAEARTTRSRPLFSAQEMSVARGTFVFRADGKPWQFPLVSRVIYRLRQTFTPAGAETLTPRSHSHSIKTPHLRDSLHRTHFDAGTIVIL